LKADAEVILHFWQAEILYGTIQPMKGAPILWMWLGDALDIGCMEGFEFGRVSGVEEVKAAAEMDDRTQDSGLSNALWIALLLLDGPFEGAFRAKLPEVDAVAEPVVVVFAESERFTMPKSTRLTTDSSQPW
jgi:hypothetical protein